LNYLTRIDHHDHEALVAIVPATGELVGVARFIRSAEDPRSAEVAFVVADRWRRQGLGGELLRRLLVRAREESIDRLTADILVGNRAMLALFRQIGPTVMKRKGSVMAVTVAVTNSTVVARDS
jgi:RimJ/RimL family protein N-acetyltransferase